jgi:hypothetical protein
MASPTDEHPKSPKRRARRSTGDTRVEDKRASDRTQRSGETAQTHDSSSPLGSATIVFSIEHREEMLKDHPVVRERYTVPTPMLIHAHEEARDRVWLRRTGVVFYGETRAGKTTCANSIRDFLREEFEDAYITIASARSSLRPKDGLMARLILEGSGHALASRPDPEALLRNVIMDVLTNLSSRGGDQYVLILDEVNLLNDWDLTGLLEIHNILAMKGIKMTTISFGQPEVLNLINSLANSEQLQIIARFFRKPVPFLSCNSEQTLAAVLRCLDEDTEWPEGSGWTYTYFFFPQAFSNGFRLSNYATAVWTALVNAIPGQLSSFTMEKIALTINDLYVGNWKADRKDFQLSDEAIINAVASAHV